MLRRWSSNVIIREQGDNGKGILSRVASPPDPLSKQAQKVKASDYLFGEGEKKERG
jgi:hypothetical protein